MYMHVTETMIYAKIITVIIVKIVRIKYHDCNYYGLTLAHKR